MFAGIGGFRSGLTKVGDLFVPVAWCEIDRYAQRAYRALYDTGGEQFYDDARAIDPAALPDIDLVCGGFPCQSFSIAGRRGGFDDARGTLFFEIARIAAVKRPTYLFLENVPGLLSHDEGWTFATILGTLSELGYDVVWQILNSKDFGVPQSRKRVYIIGFLRDRCAAEILSLRQTNAATLIQVIPGREGSRVYSPRGLATTLTSNAGGFAGNTGLYDVNLPIKVKSREGIHLLYPPYKEGYSFIDMNSPPHLTEHARCITARQDSGISKHKGEHSGVFEECEPRAILTPTKTEVRQQGRRIKDPNEPMFTITVTDKHGIMRYGKVRKLTPRECWRLQGFTDEQFDKVIATGIKDGQLYKMAGNAVSVPVITAIGEYIKAVHERNYKENINA
ncbi:MAG: DNA (cytosine-5-)-methyltransferase [Clostridia bacterium]|nr:DNA (cytosine-5-)-methyltransferase [Clostridia bacterium]